MSRDIKFRAWNHHRMIYRNLTDRNWYTDPIQGSAIAAALPNDHRTLIIMQFTGLTDINGVDIYEGDIVSCLHFTAYNGERFYHEHIVQWSDKFTGWFALNKGSMNEDDGSVQLWAYMKNNKNTAKVIDNIHQNPELLK